MSEQELKHLERELLEFHKQASQTASTTYISRGGSIVGIIFLIISSIYERQFYAFFGTFFMALIKGGVGFLILFAIISFLPGHQRDVNIKLDLIKRKSEEIEKLRKKIKKK